MVCFPRGGVSTAPLVGRWQSKPRFVLFVLSHSTRFQRFQMTMQHGGTIIVRLMGLTDKAVTNSDGVYRVAQEGGLHLVTALKKTSKPVLDSQWKKVPRPESVHGVC